MVVSHPFFCDTEGFYDLVFIFRDKLGSIKHEPYYPEDIIRNEFSLQEQETKKDKWRFCFQEFWSLSIILTRIMSLLIMQK